MTDKEKIQILMTALKSACKFIRQNPPSSVDNTPLEMIAYAVIDGNSDPDGIRFLEYFIAEAIK